MNDVRLIDANAIIKDIDNYYHNSPFTHPGTTWLRGLELAVGLVLKAPTVDAAPVVHGRWVHVPSSDMMTGKAYKCSECNKMRYGSFMPNYCGNCGAKMDGVKE